MSKRSRRKPSDPAQVAERAERKAEAARMKAIGAEPRPDAESGRMGGFRPDVVTMMQRQKKLEQAEVDAVRNLEALIERANGSSACSLAALDRVGGGQGPEAAASRRVMGQIKAARALVERQDRMDDLTWAILRQLCDGQLLVTRWRAVVHVLTGETNADAQAGVVRQAFRVLAGVEEAIVRDGQRRAA